MKKNFLYVLLLGVAFSFIGHSFYNAAKDKFVFSGDAYTQLAQVTAPGTLYTVCSSGCTNTTIQGLFSSKTLAPDDVVEVRADTAGGSKTYFGAVHVSGNGTSGHPVTLRARAGDTITIDAQNSVGNALYVGANYFVVDGINVRGAQGAQIMVGQVGSCGSTRYTDITVKNSSAYIASPDGNQNHNGINVGCANNVILKNNTITTSSANLGTGDSDCFYASSFSGLTIDGNSCTISNSASDVGTSAPHNDGLQISGGNGTNFPLGSAANLTVKNNSFIHVGSRQGYKQCIYVEYEVQGEINIFNNVCKDTAPPNNNILSVANKGFGTQGKVRIYNNSIFINGSPTAGIITDEGVPNPSIKNNIVLWSGTNDYQTCISANSATLTPSEINNNVCYKVGGTVLQNQAKSTFYPWTNWKSLGYDVNGYNALPLFVDQTSQPYDLRLQATSPAINKGADLSAYFTTDKDGNVRGTGGAWDIGAYEYTGTTPPPVTTNHIYISQSGTGDGSSCASAKPVTFVNTSSNWGTGAGQIGQGKTVHLCGTISTPISVLGSGTAGSPITILFESGAKMSAPTWTSPVITVIGRSYIVIDGGSNGIIEATNNGTNYTYKNNITGVDISASPNTEVKNLTIQNLYVRVQGSTDAVSSNGVTVDFSTSQAPSSNTSIHHNTITHVENGVKWGFDVGGQNASIYSNTIKNMSTGIIFGSKNTSATFSGVDIYKNDISDAYLWDHPSNNFHHDGIHFWGYGPAVTGLKVRDNYIYGNWGTFVTAQLYFEGSASNYLVYNNVLNAPFRHIYTKLAGPGYMHNNTIYGNGFALDSGTNNVVYFQNNILHSTSGMGYGGNVGTSPSVTYTNNLTTDPKFVNATSGDFHLQSVSPAIDGGTNLSTYFTTDKDGNARGSGGAWDIGAYEYTGTTPPPTTYALTVNSGTGSGSYVSGANVTIIANTPPSGQVFDKWTGATVANATSQTTTLTMPASATSVTATYKVAPVTTYTFSVTKSGTGTGTVTGGTINCGTTCSQTVNAGTSLTLTATPSAGSTFTGWSGACTGTTTTCTTTVNANTTVTAGFALQQTTDTTPPSVNLTSPTVGAIVSGTISPSAAASDNVGVAGIQFKLDGANLGAEDTTSPYSISWNTTMVANGNHTLTAVAKDTSGNSATASSVTVLVSNTVTSATPVGHWTFDTADISGTTILDKSGNGYNGTAAGYTASTFFVAGKIGQALNFDGVDDNVQLPNASTYNFDSTNNFTISAWIKPTVIPCGGNVCGIFNKMDGAGNGSYYFAVNGNNGLVLVIRDSGGLSDSVNSNSSIISTNVWSHVVVVFTATNKVSFYKDGVNVGSGIFTRNLANVSSPGYIGFVANLNKYFSGNIDDVRIYNRALSAAEIQSLYTAGETTPPPTTYALTVNSGTGSGNYASGASVTITANPAPSGQVFDKWTGATVANATSQTTTLTMPASATSVTATYKVATYTLSVTKSGTGTGTVTGGTINCGTTCSQTVNSGTSITLTATPATSSTFTGWSGGCSGTGSCTVTISTNATVTATFAADTTSPIVSITNPTVGATVLGTTTLSAVASDNVGVAGVQFKLNGTNLGAEDTVSPYATVLNTTAYPNGTHTVSVTARDSANNAQTGSINVTIANPVPDTTAPVISAVSTGTVTSSSTVVSFVTNEAGTTQIEYGPTTAYGTVTTLNSALTVAHSEKLSGLQAGTLYHFRVKSKDAAGNVAVSGDFTFTTANVTPPSSQISFTNLSTTPATPTETSPVTFTGLVTSDQDIQNVNLWGDWSGTWQKQDTMVTSSSELILNGAFENFTGTTASNWALVAGGATYALSKDLGRTGSAQKIEITQSGGWGIFYYQKPPLELGKTYQWTFWYKTVGTAPMIWASVTNAPNSQVVLEEQLPVTDGLWQKASYTFTWNNTGADSVRVWTNSVGSYSIDDMSLMEVKTTAGLKQVNASFTKSLPGGSYLWALEAESVTTKALSVKKSVVVAKAMQINTAPTAVSQSVSVSSDVAKIITLSGTDAESNPLSYKIVTPPAHGTLTGTAPNLTYTPAAGFVGSDSFTFKVSDGLTDSNTATVSITVLAKGLTAYLTSPKSTDTFVAPATVTLTAVASDTGSLISRVELYSDDVLIATLRNAPYIYKWNVVNADTYPLRVKAYNTLGRTLTSAAVNITVSPSAVSQAVLKIGSRVAVTGGTIRAKSAPSTILSTRKGNQLIGALGTISEGPTTLNGFVWWRVNFDSGTDGWVMAKYLVPATVATMLPPSEKGMSTRPGETFGGVDDRNLAAIESAQTDFGATYAYVFGGIGLMALIALLSRFSKRDWVRQNKL